MMDALTLSNRGVSGGRGGQEHVKRLSCHLRCATVQLVVVV